MVRFMIWRKIVTMSERAMIALNLWLIIVWSMTWTFRHTTFNPQTLWAKKISNT